MASFIPSKHEANEYNNGVQYVGENKALGITGDMVQATTINNLVESALYSQEVAERAEEIIKNVGLSAYPIGAYYISNNSTSPAELFGGAWEEIKGKFLYANNGTATGGSNIHTLNIKEIPQHFHGLYVDGNFSDNTYVEGRALVFKGDNNDYHYVNWVAKNISTVAEMTYSTTNGISVADGSKCLGEAFSTMPEYQEVYAWRRTA